MSMGFNWLTPKRTTGVAENQAWATSFKKRTLGAPANSTELTQAAVRALNSALKGAAVRLYNRDTLTRRLVADAYVAYLKCYAAGHCSERLLPAPFVARLLHTSAIMGLMLPTKLSVAEATLRIRQVASGDMLPLRAAPARQHPARRPAGWAKPLTKWNVVQVPRGLAPPPVHQQAQVPGGVTPMTTPATPADDMIDEAESAAGISAVYV